MQERRLTPFDFEDLAKAEKNIRDMKLTIFDRSGININEFKSHIRRETIRNGLDIVFLDYLSIIQAFHKTGNKHQEIDQVSKGLQSIALELNIPIVTLSQLNRFMAELRKLLFYPTCENRDRSRKTRTWSCYFIDLHIMQLPIKI